jgi:hypothetical protein
VLFVCICTDGVSSLDCEDLILYLFLIERSGEPYERS